MLSHFMILKQITFKFFLRTFESSHTAKLLLSNRNVLKKQAQSNTLILSISNFFFKYFFARLI